MVQGAQLLAPENVPSTISDVAAYRPIDFSGSATPETTTAVAQGLIQGLMPQLQGSSSRRKDWSFQSRRNPGTDATTRIYATIHDWVIQEWVMQLTFLEGPGVC